ncbi:Synaptotagmin-5 [Hibiscus syriacus]|uniref:Synaptotagmin-5 n=1 Tax=Hibiscus syriacus TaxID=106335 RepID=A0A6A2X7X6_HIBSY|nr:Synaptotagmin-5 [Hibiscus syriacus]
MRSLTLKEEVRVFTVKYKADSSVERYKARLVEKAFTQTLGVDYQETFSPVAKLNIVSVLLSLAVNMDCMIHQLDVKNAFLNGNLEDERLKALLAREFETKDLGTLRYFLGMEVARPSEGIVINQRKCILDLLSKTGMTGCKPSETLMKANLKLQKECSLVNKEQYQSWAGELIAMRSTTGYYSLVWRNLVTWRSKKQAVVSRSSAEVDIRAIALGICEGVWLQRLLTELEDATTQHMVVRIYDDEGVQAAELIGCAQILLSELEPGGKVKDVWLNLVKDLEIQRYTKYRGQVHLELFYCPFGMENSFKNPFSSDISMTSLERVLKNGGANGTDGIENEKADTHKKREAIIRVLSVTVISAGDLPIVDLMGKSDPYAVLTMKKSDAINRTRVVNNSSNPVWNQTFDFVFEDGLHDMLILEVWDHDTFGKVPSSENSASSTQVSCENRFIPTPHISVNHSSQRMLKLLFQYPPAYDIICLIEKTIPVIDCFLDHSTMLQSRFPVAFVRTRAIKSEQQQSFPSPRAQSY